MGRLGRRMVGPGVLCALLAAGAPRDGRARVVCASDGSAPPARIVPRGCYAVAVSETADAQPAWRAVAEALRAKYAASVIVFPAGRPQEALPELRRLFPAYIAWVAPPEECGRGFVVAVHRLARQLDDDPYGDALWGILTGYEPADALRMARLSEPLTIRRGATSMGPSLLERVESGFASNEAKVTDFWTREAGDAAAVHRVVSPDAARALAEAFNARPVDVFYTSGHATERDWQVAYNLPGGAFRHGGGSLFALSTDGTRCAIASPNPKVYLPVGNCLIGHIDRRDCMATAWLHAGGIGQMLGYTVVTFYGYMGWGTGLLFDDGRLTFAEAFFLNNQALLQQLATRFPALLGAAPESYEPRGVRALAERCGQGGGDALGLLWDRDTVAFYGDPAWVARYPCVSPAAVCRLDEEGGLWTLRVTVQKAGGLRDPKWGERPFALMLPERLAEIRDVACDRPVEPVVTERFALVPLTGCDAAGDAVTVRFRARRTRREAPEARGAAGAGVQR